MPTLVFTGGGTAGHVMPNLALAPRLREQGWTLHYIGSAAGPERTLAEGAGIPFHAVATGKLRRYFSWRNFTDPARVIAGAFQAFSRLGTLKPDLVFSKGGFVAVPVVYAARLRGIPVVLHESDLTPGLANRLCLRLCRRICVSFPETRDHLPASARAKCILTGSPIRPELLRGDKAAGLAFLGFTTDKPVLLVMGGSLGAKAVNEALRANLDWILKTHQIVHLCGKGWLSPEADAPGYRQFEFLGAELADVMAAADAVVSRAGANSLFELLALRKPMLLIPLPGKASRGDQILNAESFAHRGLAHVLLQENLAPEVLRDALARLGHDAPTLIRNMEASGLSHGTGRVLEVIAGEVGAPLP
ncbi:MAG TPA: undecaprenyldiphospho-muramoylpentapeptide beta-N-acetylglucosaminyltransferase [Fibrobacteria bacterium]|nr:undecaprenyldiphospho-muramoylpentapeptide beta-N-acetylglucosaminyltransferase [Fibrobacteria bacterium]